MKIFSALSLTRERVGVRVTGKTLHARFMRFLQQAGAVHGRRAAPSAGAFIRYGFSVKNNGLFATPLRKV
jgi:hypothetical protein